MTVKEFRALSRKRKNYEITPVSQIRMISDIHTKNDSSTIFGLQKSVKNLLVIVHKNDNGTYNLITGWKDYTIAVRGGIKEVKAVLVEETNREEFLYRLSATADWLSVDEISVPKIFEVSPPKKEKIDKCIEQIKTAVEKYTLSDYLDGKPIKVNKDNVLQDGYTRYIALKTIGYKGKFPVIRKDR